jgi:hypothetical protein
MKSTHFRIYPDEHDDDTPATSFKQRKFAQNYLQNPFSIRWSTLAVLLQENQILK